VAIAGVYATQQARLLEHRTSFDVCLEAVLGALDDAGLKPVDVDGAALDWPGPGGCAAVGGITYPGGEYLLGDAGSWASLLGGRLGFIADGFYDCSGPHGVIKAAAAISAGLCDTVVVGGGAAGREVAERYSSVAAGTGSEFNEPWGSYVPAAWGLEAQRHMYEFGTTPEQLAEVAATIRNHGHVNPEAVMFGRGPYTVDDILASPMIASPFHRLDLSLVAQGGGAVVLTSAERAADLRQPAVLVLGGGMDFLGGVYQNPPAWDEVGHLGRSAVARAYGMAGIGPSDIDVFCLYDATSFEVIRQFEVLGLCGEGEGGPFIEGGTIALDGAHPTNPDGGCLAYTWNVSQQQTLKVVECVKQLRGQAGNRQVSGAEAGVVAGPGGANLHFAALILGRG
jgi:acetyl-CoA acetyltransferase